MPAGAGQAGLTAAAAKVYNMEVSFRPDGCSKTVQLAVFGKSGMGNAKDLPEGIVKAGRGSIIPPRWDANAKQWALDIENGDILVLRDAGGNSVNGHAMIAVVQYVKQPDGSYAEEIWEVSNSTVKGQATMRFKPLSGRGRLINKDNLVIVRPNVSGQPQMSEADTTKRFVRKGSAAPIFSNNQGSLFAPMPGENPYVGVVRQLYSAATQSRVLANLNPGSPVFIMDDSSKSQMVQVKYGMNPDGTPKLGWVNRKYLKMPGTAQQRSSSAPDPDIPRASTRRDSGRTSWKGLERYTSPLAGRGANPSTKF